MPIISSKASMSAQAYGLFGVTAAPFTLTGSYDALATVTVPSGGASSITFSAIPQTGYSHLEIRGIGKTTNASAAYIIMQINNDATTSDYYWHYLSGNGSSASAGNGNGFSGVVLNNTLPASGTTNVFGAVLTEILDYSSVNKNKTIRSLLGFDANGSGTIEMDSSGWFQTASINSLTLTPSAGNFAQFSQFSLFGIK